MQAELNIPKVEDCIQWLGTVAEGYTATQSIGWLTDQMGQLCHWLAFTNEQMAVAHMALQKAKNTAYIQLIFNLSANRVVLPASVMKDFVMARVSEESYRYTVCERCSRTIVHQIDALRTCISALKEEAKIAAYIK